MTTIRALVLLLDLLTDFPALAALARDVFTFGLVNTTVVLTFATFEIGRRLKLRRNWGDVANREFGKF
jgi:hypothetical protein